MTMRHFFGAVFCLVAGCANVGFWPLSQDAVAIVSIDPPDFCMRKVETLSDSVLIRPDYQTVITQGCERWDGMSNAPVVWVLVDEPPDPSTPASERKLIEKRAIQQFRAGSAKVVQPAKSLKDFVALAKKHPDVPIRVIGYTDDRGSQKGNARLSLSRAKAVAKWLESEGVDRKRIELGADGGNNPIGDNRDPAGRASNRRAESVITLIVTGA